jgi:hypothetical protein
MQDLENRDRAGILGVDNHVIGSHDHLTCAGNAAAAIESGVFEQLRCLGLYVVFQALRGVWTVVRDVVDN